MGKYSKVNLQRYLDMRKTIDKIDEDIYTYKEEKYDGINDIYTDEDIEIHNNIMNVENIDINKEINDMTMGLFAFGIISCSNILSYNNLLYIILGLAIIIVFGIDFVKGIYNIIKYSIIKLRLKRLAKK